MAKRVVAIARDSKSEKKAKAAIVRSAKTVKEEPKQPDTLSKEDFDLLILNHRDNGRKLARSILRRWRVRMSAEEIDSIVDLTLCEAAKRYSPKFGASFMTFFFYHLRGHLVRAVANAAHTSNVFLSVAQNLGIEPGDWNFQLGTDAAWSYVPDGIVFGHREIETPEHALIKKEETEICREACGQLDNLQRQIIDRSYGDEQALVDIAKELGYSRCHISRVKKVALKKLKGFLDKRDTAAENAALHSIEGGRRSGRRNRRRTATLTLVREEVLRIAKSA